ncbi:MAG: two-partner secretion domain-containing protein, partial [Pseudomonadales bacterium]
GNAAHVVVANPHGITCDGCGFINTPRVTLSTGTPIIENGQLDRFDVNGGHIGIEGQGLNASNVDQFDLITRSAKINAELHANKLNIITGRNLVDAATLAATAKAPDGSDKPLLAIDSSALGGMYAGAIRLVGTEAGVGVKLAGDMAASAGDIQIDANGQLRMANAASSADIKMSAQSVDLNGQIYAGQQLHAQASGAIVNRKSLAARERVELKGGQLNNQGVIESGVNPDNSRNSIGDVALSGQGLRNSGSVVARRDLSTTITQQLDNRGGTLSGQTNTKVSAANLNNSADGRMLSQGALSVVADELDNGTGLISSGKNLSVTANTELSNQAGEISSQAAVTLSGGRINNRGGLIVAGTTLEMTAGSLDNGNAGTLSAQGNLTAAVSGKLNNQDKGAVLSQGVLSVQAQEFTNSNGGLVSGKSDVNIDVQELLDNSTQGTLLADGKLSVEAAELSNGNRGQIAAKGDLQVTVDSLSQQGDAATQAGELLSQGKLTLVAKDIDNRQGGLIAAAQGLDIRSSDTLHNSGGEISTKGKAVLHVLANDGQPAALLDNSGAGLIVGDLGLELTVQRLLNNAKGVLAGRDNLVIVGDSLDNRDGTLSSQTALSVALTGELTNRDQGALLSGGSLTVSANGLDNRAGGVISAKQALSITTGQLDNQNKGIISTDAGLTIGSSQLNNHDHGTIAGKGAVQVTASGFDQQNNGQLVSETALTLDLQNGKLNNSRAGLIATPGALLLKNLGQVDNSAGGEISSTKSFLLKATELDNGGGRVISGEGLELRITQALLNNLKGALSAANQLSVTAASLDNSGGGMLVSKGDLDVTIDGTLANHDQGLISAGQALSVSSGSLVNANKGLLASGGALTLTTGAVDNQGGSIASQSSLKATTADFDNRGGVLSSKQAFTLDAANVDNRDGGLIVSATGLTLTADSLDSSREAADVGGEVSAAQDLNLTVARLIQRQGRLIGGAGVSLNVLGGDVDNRGGVLFANGPLTFANLRKLDNRDAGEVSSNQSYSLSAAEVDNGEKGRLISADTLFVELGTGTLRNAAEGLVSGLNGLTVNAGNLDNSGAGTLSSRDGALSISLSGGEQVLNNSGQGALVSKGPLDVRAKTLNNSNQGILSSTGNLGLTLDGKLDNHDGGLIETKGELTVVAGEVDNRSGQISSQLAGNLSATSLDNSAGNLSSAGGLSVTLAGKLFNTQKAQLASAGPLILSAGEIDNRGGSLISQDLLSIHGRSLNNSDGGTLAAGKNLDVVLTGALTNSAKGLVHSETGTLDIQAQSLNNAGGTLHSQGDLTLNLNGTLGNQDGRIDSQAGNLHLKKSSSVDNTGGALSSLKGWLEVITGGLFNNDTGTTQAQSVKITAKGVDNRAGHISALSGVAEIAATGATVNNQGGGLYADGLLKVSAGAFNNQGTQAGTGGKVAAGQIDFGLSGALNNSFGLIESESSLNLGASGIANSGGGMRSLGTSGTTLIKGGLLDNRSGLIETANTALQLDVNSLQNAGGTIRHVGTGTFGLSAANVMAAGGTLISNGVLGITADSWINNSVLQAGTLNLNIGNFTQTASGQLLASQSFIGTGGTWTNDGLVASDGSLNINLSGSYGGAGRVTSLGNLSLGAASIDLPTTAHLSGGGLTTVTSTGLLSNRGRLTSAGDLTLRAGTLNNYGTLGSAEKLKLYASTLLNDKGLIFSGSNMALRVNNFTNTYADVYSLGGLDIARDDQLARSSAVQNISATIESAGNMHVRAQRFDNRSEVFSLGRTLVSGYIAVRCYDCSGSTYNVDYIVKEFYEGGVLDESPSAFIISGGNFVFDGGDFLNRSSSISAAQDITIRADYLSNIGSLGGSIERTRTYNTGGVTDGTVERFVAGYVVPYNQRNNPNFPNVYYADSNGVIRTAVPKAGTYYDYDVFYDDVRLFDSVTGKEVNVPHGYGTRYVPRSQYDPTNLLQMPTELAARYKLIDDIEVAQGGGDVRNAVIQAGGNVSIQASQMLENSVIRHDYRPTAGANRLGNTTTQGTGKTTVVVLNSQLPPDLQQRQVNPLSLPGFILPQGDNGLFRLSDQTVKNVGTSAAQGATGDNNFNASRVSVNTGRDAQGPVATDGSAWSMQSGQNGIAPTNAASLDIKRVEGLPSSAAPKVGHKYLIETNPALTDLKQFMSSDYLLGNLGYDTDATQKRLGDGLYEQRLIREAIVARTGQRYLAGLTNDEAMFRYLMDNALASKNALGLSLGISLTGEQVAALTHDIVWMEEHEVMGEKVLVPVLYLAQAEGRLAANGALIQGRDVTLISGGDLINQGTLRASNSLNATAENIVNSGLLEAGDRLQLLASDSIRNAQGGIVAGRDVSLTALTGDVINERSVARHEVNYGSRHTIQDYVDTAARIEAANSLNVAAGRDIANLGGVLESRGDLTLNAGRDVTIASVEERALESRGNHFLNEQVTQFGAQVSAGRDLDINAGRDLAVIASRLQADADVAMSAGNDVLIASAADESHYLSKSKKVIRQKDSVSQQSSEILAGGNVAISASNDLVLSASKVQAGDEAYLVAGENLALLSAEDYDYSLYQKKKSGSFGRKSFKRDEVTQVTHVGSEVSAGGDVTLLSGGDQLYQAAKLESGNDLTLASGGAITFEGVKDLEQESHEKSKSSLAWQSAKGKGTTDETLRQSVLIAKGETVINAVDGLKIDIKHVDQQTVSQTIDAMVQADPQLAWIKEAEARGDVDWQRVKEVHDSFKYSQSGLGGGAAMVIAIIVAYFTAGAASGLVASAASSAGATATATAAGGAWAAGTGASLAGIGWANAAVTAGLTGMASNGAISTINNRGNLGAVLSDVTSEDAMRGYAVAGITAGLTNGLFDGWMKTETGTGTAGALQNAGKVMPKGGLGTLGGIGQFAGNQLLQNGTSTVLDRALGGDSKLSDALRNSLASTFAAAGFNLVGDVSGPSQLDLATGSMSKIALHAVMGGLAAEAVGGDFKTGALAAGLNEALVGILAEQYAGMDVNEKKSLLVMNSQLIGVLAAGVQGGDEKDLQTGAWVAGNATQYNYTVHEANSAEIVKNAVSECARSTGCSDQFGEVSAEKLIEAINALASKDIDRVNAQDTKAIQMAGYLLRDVDIHEAILVPDTTVEKVVAGGKTTVEVADTAISVIGAGGLIKGLTKSVPDIIKSLFKNSDDLASGTASFGEVRKVLESAQAPYKGSTVIGHALSKHAGRSPDIWGKTTGAMSSWNDQAMKHLREIARAPGEFKQVTTDKGLTFMEKRLPDGRGARLNMDGTFKGFID